MRWFLAALSLVSACRLTEPRVVICNYIMLPAVAVEVTDAQTGRNLTEHAVGILRDGTYTDSLHLHDGSCYGPSEAALRFRCGGYERIGTYEVQVNHEGYRPWSLSGVAVTRDECHVKTVVVSAKLVPAP